MISSAFRSASQNEASQRNKGISTITKGVSSAAVAVAGALGFAGGLGEGVLAKSSEHALANRIGGIGGNIMLATLDEKKQSAISNEEKGQLFTKESISSSLGDNPINRAAKKKLNTVFDTLVLAKEQGIVKNNKIKSDIGDIDPNSELGKKVLASLQQGGGKEDSKKKYIDPKQEQLDIINKYNPAPDSYHTWIRDIKDIKTFEEVIDDEESFVWGDYSKEDALRDLKKGTITIYSSKPIKQGAFVSTSKKQAEEYAGGPENKIFSATVPLEEIAWINGDEGQYAKKEVSK